MFLVSILNRLSIDLIAVLGIHLLLSSLLCFGYGYYHLTGVYGPGLWSSDGFGLIGSVRGIKPVYSLVSIATSRYGSISSHHIVSGLFGLFVSIFHICTRPQSVLYSIFRIYNF